jgi:hypothetical protein
MIGTGGIPSLRIVASDDLSRIAILRGDLHDDDRSAKSVHRLVKGTGRLSIAGDTGENTRER